MSDEYRKRVQKMCEDLHIANPIHEADLAVGEIEFRVDGEWRTVVPTDMNRAGRLFFQYHFGGLQNVVLTGGILQHAKKLGEKHFGAMWEDAEEKGRVMILNLKQATLIKYTVD